MKDFNSYLDNLDYSLVKDLFHEKGKQRIYHKKDFFIRQNEISRFAEWVENGTFQYTYIDGEGEEHIVGYAFTNEFVCDYSSLMRSGLSLVNIQAITECSVYKVSASEFTEAIEELATHVADFGINEQDYSILLRYFSFGLHRLKSYRVRFEQEKNALFAFN